MSQHTPGPWIIRPSGEVGTEDRLIAVVYPTPSENADAHDANARLIAAAPALREALEGMLAIADRYTKVGLKEIDAARAALALAEGKETNHA